MNAATIDEIARMRALAADVLLAADLLEGISSPPIAPDGSGSVPPLNDPDPSPTLPVFGVIVTLGEDLPAGSQLWVRRESWGGLAVDQRPTPGASWGLGRFYGLTVEDAP